MKHFLPLVEFHVTNSCNFNCTGCNHFNNYTFKGHQQWDDLKHIYAEWAKRIDIGRYSIIGGEPMLVPDIKKWIVGLRELWPDSDALILSNGSHDKKFDKHFFQILKDTNTRLDLGLHNLDRLDSVMNMVLRNVEHPVDITRTPKNLQDIPGFDENWKSSYQQIKDASWPNCDTVDHWDSLPEHIKQECANDHNFSPAILAEQRKNYVVKDATGYIVHIDQEDFFSTPTFIERPDHNNFTLHNSDPVKAHTDCYAKYCHYMMDGKLSKCGQSVLFKEFDKQFELVLSDSDRELMLSYRELLHDDDQTVFDQFMEKIRDPIPQCKFCPESLEFKKISAGPGKNRFGKRKNNGS